MVQPVQVLHHLPKQYHNIVSPVINAYSADYTPTVPLFILARLETAMIKAPFTFLLKLCHPVQTNYHNLQKYQIVMVVQQNSWKFTSGLSTIYCCSLECSGSRCSIRGTGCTNMLKVLSSHSNNTFDIRCIHRNLTFSLQKLK